MKKLIYYLFIRNKLFVNLIKWNKKINKKFFFYFFCFNFNRNKFLKKYKVNVLYDYANKIFNNKFFIKKTYYLFFFNKKFIINLSFLFKNLRLLYFFLSIRFLNFLKNLNYLFIFQMLIIWLNYYILLKKNKIEFVKNSYIYYNLLWINLRKSLSIIKKPCWQHFTFFKFNYILYNNIIKWLL